MTSAGTTGLSHSASTSAHTPKWLIHQGTGHLMRAWDGLSAVTWCSVTIYGVRQSDFREPSAKRGERECRRCMEAKQKGEE